eukprot:GHVT01054244.1.p1 GENE.GHVT01054244.1~~GHVT01054244.1.p1  ORF type:complete len:381 (+),score=38.66 GHVT01054244.1:303-1445(+)
MLTWPCLACVSRFGTKEQSTQAWIEGIVQSMLKTITERPLGDMAKEPITLFLVELAKLGDAQEENLSSASGNASTIGETQTADCQTDSTKVQSVASRSLRQLIISHALQHQRASRGKAAQKSASRDKVETTSDLQRLLRMLGHAEEDPRLEQDAKDLRTSFQQTGTEGIPAGSEHSSPSPHEPSPTKRFGRPDEPRSPRKNPQQFRGVTNSRDATRASSPTRPADTLGVRAAQAPGNSRAASPTVPTSKVPATTAIQSPAKTPVTTKASATADSHGPVPASVTPLATSSTIENRAGVSEEARVTAVGHSKAGAKASSKGTLAFHTRPIVPSDPKEIEECRLLGRCFAPALQKLLQNFDEVTHAPTGINRQALPSERASAH